MAGRGSLVGKFKCRDIECNATVFAMGNPMQCPRCFKDGMMYVESNVPTDVPSALAAQYNEQRVRENERSVEQEIERGLVEIEQFLSGR
jgi:hypothetical protein